MRKLQLALISGCLIAICGCGPNYDAQLDFGDNCWSLNDTLTSAYDIQKDKPVSVAINLEMLPDYEYMNIHLKLLLESPSGKTSTMMLNDTLIDPLGNWTVEPSWGKYMILIKTPEWTQAEEGSYLLKLIHNMRDDNLCNISTVGVQLFKQ